MIHMLEFHQHIIRENVHLFDPIGNMFHYSYSPYRIDESKLIITYSHLIHDAATTEEDIKIIKKTYKP